MYNVGIAYILWLVSGFGALGLHRFYLGKIPTGLLWMFTGGLGTVGAIYDFFTLSRQVQEANIRLEVQRKLHSLESRPVPEQTWRYAESVHTRKAEKESSERTILRIARKNRGMVSASEIALEANIPLEEAKKALDLLANKGFAELRVRSSGSLVYTFPEFMDDDSPLEDF
mgnify:CR=1 FL=1